MNGVAWVKIGQIRPNNRGMRERGREVDGKYALRNVSANSFASAKDKPFGEARPFDTMSEIDDTYLRSSVTAKPHPSRRRLENTRKRSSPS